jgi:rfaE bifunctional protein nucleotidyltransferase chain/domain
MGDLKFFRKNDKGLWEVDGKISREEAKRRMAGLSGPTKNVWTNGCYDILHVGHIRLFEYAKSLGDTLVVGIDSDSRVKELKGEGRPINSQEDRKEMLLSNQNVDAVFIFDSSEELSSLVKSNGIHTMVVGDDYKSRKVIGSEYAKEVVFFEKIQGFSTTNIIGRDPQ